MLGPVGWIVVVAGLLLAGLALLVWLAPQAASRAFLWLVAHTVYRIRTTGLENVPKTGPALLVCNHISFVDWLLIRAAIPRPARFLVYAGYANRWPFSWFLKAAHAIPVAGAAGPRAIVQALRAASEALKQGELVCIFAEGALTRPGFTLPFHRGFEQILKNAPAPIIPVCLDQVWGSVFSYHGGKLFSKWPQE